MTYRKMPVFLILALFTVGNIFSMSSSWSGTEQSFLKPGLQILKSEIMAINHYIN